MVWRQFRSWLAKDAGASPVIGVILMVGTTVVLGASVYAWSSAYSHVPEQGVKVISLLPQGEVDGDARSYVVAAVMPGLRYGDILFRIDDELQALVTTPGCVTPAVGEIIACEHARTLHARDLVSAGDHVVLRAEQGQVVRLVDSAAGAVILQFTVT